MGHELTERYKRLKGHLGFPDGSCDPVFLKDKIAYLFAMLGDDTLPTFKLDLPRIDSDGDLKICSDDADDLKEFLELTKSYPGCAGWVVKTPYTTHGSIYRGIITYITVEK